MSIVNHLLERKAHQFRFFHSLLRMTRSTGSHSVIADVGADAKLDPSELNRIAVYGEHEHLIEWVPGTADAIRLTAYGRAEIERALAKPDEATSHFPPIGTLDLPRQADAA